MGRFIDGRTDEPSLQHGFNDRPIEAAALGRADTVYDAQGRVDYTDDAHQQGQPADVTHTIYDADGRTIATERFSGDSITVTPGAGDQGASAFTQGANEVILSVTDSVYNAVGWVTYSDSVQDRKRGQERMALPLAALGVTPSGWRPNRPGLACVVWSTEGAVSACV